MEVPSSDNNYYRLPSNSQGVFSEPDSVVDDKAAAKTTAIVQEAVQEKLSELTSTDQPIKIAKSEPLTSADGSFKPGPNEPSVHVYLKEKKLDSKETSEVNATNSASCPHGDGYVAPGSFIGWNEMTSPQHRISDEVAFAQVAHWKNVTVIYSAVFFTWLGVALGGGIAWCLLVIGCCSSYYQNTVTRYRRAARDDAIRELWIQKLENESETVGWLNNFLDRFWVIYEPGLSATIKSVVDSVLEVSTPPFLESLSLTTFQLGNKAPRIHAVKTYPNTEPDVVVMDWDIEFMPSNDLDMTKRQCNNQINPKVILQIRVGKGMVGAGMPVLVENFALQGKMRIKITFGHQFPHVEIVGLQFLSQPEIDYVLKPVGGDTFGFDIAHIPGLSSFIRDQIHAILAPMMYKPNEFLLNIGEMMNPVAINQIAGILRVNIRYARDLKFKDGSGDPYVKVTGSTKYQERKTSTKSSTTKPDWNEVHSILVYESDESLKFTVIDYNSFRKDIECGSVNLDLNSFKTKNVQSGLTLTLQRGLLYVGALTLDCHFFPTLPSTDEAKPPASDEVAVSATPPSKAGVLRITLHQIKDLDASKSMIGKFTPYCFVMLNNITMHETMKKKRNNNPVYEDSIDCVINDISQATISLNIKDDKGLALDPIIAQWSSPAIKVIENASGWFPLNNVATGKVKMSAKFFPVQTGESNSLVTSASSNFFGVVQLYIMEAPQLKTYNPRSELHVRVSVGGVLKARTSSLPGEFIPRWNQSFFIPVSSPTDIIKLELVENNGGDYTIVGTIDHSVLNLVHKSDEDYQTRDLLNFWSPLVARNDKSAGTLHFGSCFFKALPAKDKAPLTKAEDSKNPSDQTEALIDSESAPDESALASCLVTFTVHGAKGLDETGSSSMSASAFLNGKGGKHSQLIFETKGQRSSGNPVWEKTGTVFSQDVKSQSLAVIIQNANSQGVGRFEMPVVELLNLKEKSRVWFPLEGGKEIQITIKHQAVEFEENLDMDLLLGCGRLKVYIMEARDLVGVDSSGTSDPYVKSRINNFRVHKTQVVKKNLNPVFNEQFEAPVLDPTTAYFTMEVFDWNKLNSSEKIGTVSLPLGELGLEPPSEKWYKLENPSKKGYIKARVELIHTTLSDDELNLAVNHMAGLNSAGLIRHSTSMSASSSSKKSLGGADKSQFGHGGSNMVMKIVSIQDILDETASGNILPIARDATGRAGKLQLRILGGEKLIAVDRNGTSDPYVKVKHEGKVLYQTKTISKDCNPSWNEVTVIKLEDGSPYWLHFSVMDHNRIHADMNLGDLLLNIWDYIKLEDPSTFQCQFWTRELCGGEPGHLHIELQFIPN